MDPHRVLLQRQHPILILQQHQRLPYRLAPYLPVFGRYERLRRLRSANCERLGSSSPIAIFTRRIRRTASSIRDIGIHALVHQRLQIVR